MLRAPVQPRAFVDLFIAKVVKDLITMMIVEAAADVVSEYKTLVNFYTGSVLTLFPPDKKPMTTWSNDATDANSASLANRSWMMGKATWKNAASGVATHLAAADSAE